MSARDDAERWAYLLTAGHESGGDLLSRADKERVAGVLAAVSHGAMAAERERDELRAEVARLREVMREVRSNVRILTRDEGHDLREVLAELDRLDPQPDPIAEQARVIEEVMREHVFTFGKCACDYTAPDEAAAFAHRARAIAERLAQAPGKPA